VCVAGFGSRSMPCGTPAAGRSADSRRSFAHRSCRFEGSTARELSRAFRESVDTYLDLCADTGQPPDRPFNGKILVRTEPSLHRKAALRAAAEGVSLSQWITRQIESAP
jgi:predicted HicB family RNase H-like nuclease